MRYKTIAQIENSLSCRACYAPLESYEYRFCDSQFCQGLYIRIIERKISMRHKFEFDIATTNCKVCARNLMDHTGLARCEKCNKQTECELIEGTLLLCVICESEHLLSRKQVLESETHENIRQDVVENLDELSPSELLNKAREIDSSLRYHGDFFNLETIALSKVKEAIFKNELIPKELKIAEYTNAIANRIFAFQEKLIKNNQENFELYQKIAAAKSDLRTFGNDVRKEVQERIKSQDELYEIRLPKQVKPRVKAVKKEKKNPQEMLIEAIMTSNNCTRERALKIMVDRGLYQNMDNMENK